MEIKLTNEQMEAIVYEEDLIVDGERWEFVEQDGSVRYARYSCDEVVKYDRLIYRRLSDDKCFSIYVTYDNHGYVDYAQDFIAYEVEKKEVTRTEWAYVE